MLKAYWRIRQNYIRIIIYIAAAQARGCGSYIQIIHTDHTHRSYTQIIHRSCIQILHTDHTYRSCIQIMHIYTSYIQIIQIIHTDNTCRSYTQNIHTDQHTDHTYIHTYIQIIHTGQIYISCMHAAHILANAHRRTRMAIEIDEDVHLVCVDCQRHLRVHTARSHRSTYPQRVF